MKILLATYHFYPSVGGMELIVADLGEQFVRQGHDVTVACASMPSRSEYHHRGMRIVDFRFDGIIVEGSHCGEDMEVYRHHIIEERYDVAFLICEPIHWPLFGAPLDSRTRLVAVPCINDETVWRLRHLPTVAKQIRYALHSMDAVIAITSVGEDARFLRESGIPFECIPNGIPEINPSDHFFERNNIPNDRPIILHPANFFPEKNHSATLALAEALNGQACVVMMGNVPRGHENYGERLFHRASTMKNVTVLQGKSREEVLGALKESTLMILPSYAEGAPLTVLEAMSVGTPFVVSDRVGSRADIAGGKVSSLPLFIDVVKELLGNDIQRKTLSEEGQNAFIKEFRIEHVAGRYLRVAKRVTEKISPASWQNISFCIITNGKRPETTRKVIDAIHSLKIPHYEIIIAGVWDSEPGITVLSLPDEAGKGLLGSMRNAACAHAHYETLCVIDDDTILEESWYDGFLRFGSDFDAQCARIRNPDGTRVWDWTCDGGPRGHTLLDEWDDDFYIYATGGYILFRRKVWEKIQWNPTLGFGEAEDSEFAYRLKTGGYRIAFNPHCRVLHADARYTQRGSTVEIVSEIPHDAESAEAKRLHEHYAPVHAKETFAQTVSRKTKKEIGKALQRMPKLSLHERRRAFDEIQKFLLVGNGTLEESLAGMMVAERLRLYNPGMRIGFLGPEDHRNSIALFDDVTLYSSRWTGLAKTFRNTGKEHYDVALSVGSDAEEYGAFLSRFAAPNAFTISRGNDKHRSLFDHVEPTRLETTHYVNVIAFVAARALCGEEGMIKPFVREQRSAMREKKYDAVVDVDKIYSDTLQRQLQEYYGDVNTLSVVSSMKELLSSITMSHAVVTTKPHTSLLCSILDTPCLFLAKNKEDLFRWYPLSYSSACVLIEQKMSITGSMVREALNAMKSNHETMEVFSEKVLTREEELMMDRFRLDASHERRVAWEGRQ